MESLKFESDAVGQSVSVYLSAMLGLALAYACRGFDRSGFSTTLAGFLLGLLFLGLGIAGVVTGAAGARRVIVVDPVQKNIRIQDSSRFGTKTRLVAFRQIQGAYLHELGDNEGGCASYDVVLRLRGGATLPLFGGALFDGRWNKGLMENRMRQLQRYVGTVETAPP